MPLPIRLLLTMAVFVQLKHSIKYKYSQLASIIFISFITLYKSHAVFRPVLLYVHFCVFLNLVIFFTLLRSVAICTCTTLATEMFFSVCSLRRLWLQSCVVSSHFNRTFIELYSESAVESHTDTILLVWRLQFCFRILDYYIHTGYFEGYLKPLCNNGYWCFSHCS